jgi:hypothetical protein
MSLDSITRYVATIKMYGLKTVLGVGNAEIRGGIPCLKGIRLRLKRVYK